MTGHPEHLLTELGITPQEIAIATRGGTLNTTSETMTPATQDAPLGVQLFRRFYNEQVRAGCRPEDVPEITESELRAKYGYATGATKPGVSIGELPLATYLSVEGTKHAVAAIRDYRANKSYRLNGLSIGDHVECVLADHSIETPPELLEALNARQSEFGTVPTNHLEHNALRRQIGQERLAG